jgi:tetratricopeptide (TPR) repeat protein
MLLWSRHIATSAASLKKYMNLTENKSAKLDRDLVGIALLITSITFLAVLRFEFVYDDYPQIVNNPFVKSWKYLPQYFVSSVWKQAFVGQSNNYYRPLFMVWTRLNYALFAGRPFGWHLGALALHLIVTWLVYRVIREMSGRTDLAWITALVFGVHPIHHEVVGWVSGTTESLCAILFLAAFLAYLRFRENSKSAWMILSCALYGVALLCKETAFVLPALVFIHGWASDSSGEAPGTEQPTGGWKPSLQAALWYVPVALVYLAMRYKALSGFSHPGSDANAYEWLLTLPSMVLVYLRHWFLPIRLGWTYDLYYQRKVDLVHVILPALALFAVGAVIWLCRKRLGSREVTNAIAWIVFPLLPALDTFIFKPDELVHDRYFYIPSIGAALLVALIVSWLGSARIGLPATELAGRQGFATPRKMLFGQPVPIVVAGFALAIVLSLCAMRETDYWRNDFVLCTRAHEISPHNPTATSNLGAELIGRDDLDAAQSLLEEGYREHGDFRLAFNLGRVYYGKQQFEEARRYTERTLELEPNFPEAHVSMAEIELKQNHAQEAQMSLRRAVELDPYSASFHTSYGIVLALNGDCATATRQFEAAIDLNPGDFFATSQLLRCRNAASPASAPGSKPGRL